MRPPTPTTRSSKGAASTAMYVAEGSTSRRDVHRGERGSILNPKMDRPGSSRTSPRSVAGRWSARDILGVRQDWLGFVDSGVAGGRPEPPLPEGCFALVPLEGGGRTAGPLIRSFRPHGDDARRARWLPHPDHVKCHEVSGRAFRAAADPERYPELGEPWQVSLLYYHPLVQPGPDGRAARAMLEHGLESPGVSGSRE